MPQYSGYHAEMLRGFMPNRSGYYAFYIRGITPEYSGYHAKKLGVLRQFFRGITPKNNCFFCKINVIELRNGVTYSLDNKKTVTLLTPSLRNYLTTQKISTT